MASGVRMPATRAPRVAVAVAASAGGVEALKAFVGSLPATFPGIVLVVLHLPETGPSVLPSILGRVSALRVVAGHQATLLEEGLVVVAPPGRHLRVEDGVANVDRGPREHGHRPSADALFRSVAEAFGPRAAGVVLSGTMDDGSLGLRAIGEHGGLTVVQDPSEALFPGMPRAAIAEARPRLVCGVDAMGEEIARWADSLGPVEVGDLPRPTPAVNGERGRGHTSEQPPEPAELTAFTCPECGGTLWVHRQSVGADRFECRVGHGFSARTLLAGKQDALEAALWAAVVALEERAGLSRRVLRRLEGSGRPSHLRRYRDEIDQDTHRIELLRQMIDAIGYRGPLVDDADTGTEDGAEHHFPDTTE